MKEIQDFTRAVIANVETVIVGKRSVVEMLVLAVLCDGHVLLEDNPGTGKTMLARSMAQSLGVVFKRLQCTPDLLPNDVTGVSVFNQKSAEFEFRPGPAFSNILLADEINRATPRTQSALLEAMAEGQVSVDGKTYKLPQPFLVLATQNPIEFEGTFPLPEAQLDRFFMRLHVGYPDFLQESQMLVNLQRSHPVDRLRKVVEGSQLPKLWTQVRNVHVDETVRNYLLTLVHYTRQHPELVMGASPRGSLGLFRAAQALAAMRGRDYVLPDDVKTMAVPCLAHRLIMKPETALKGRSAVDIMNELIQNTKIPV